MAFQSIGDAYDAAFGYGGMRGDRLLDRTLMENQQLSDGDVNGLPVLNL